MSAISGACIAASRHHMVCVDKDVAKIAALGGGEIPICEPGLHGRKPIIGAASARSVRSPPPEINSKMMVLLFRDITTKRCMLSYDL